MTDEEQIQEAPPVGGASEYAVPEKYTVAVDFDGVLNSYISGWVAPDVLPDPPVAGAIEWLTAVAEHYEIVVLTTRARYPEAVPEIDAWLRNHGFDGDCTITAEKGPAVIYIGWRFRGTFPSVEQIRRAYPWRTGDPPPKNARDGFRKKVETIRMLEEKQTKLKRELRTLKAAAALVVDAFSAVDDPTLEALGRLVGGTTDDRVQAVVSEVKS